MFALRMRLVMAVLAWIATRFMRRLSFPALVIAIVLEILLSVARSAMPKKEESKGPESIKPEGRKVQLD
jgi:uncharacterized membrane protein YadS